VPGLAVGNELDFLIFQELPNRGARLGGLPRVAVRAFGAFSDGLRLTAADPPNETINGQTALP